MKTSTVVAIATSLAAAVSASGVHPHRHEHLHHEARDAPVVISSDVNTVSTTCGCTTVYTTFYGLPTLVTPSTSVPASSVPASSVTTSSVSVPAASVQVSTAPAPTNVPTTFATPGVYTIPAVTVTVPSTVTVCDATSTSVTSGTNVVGGVVTVVETATTFVCPYATTSSVSGTVTSILTSTEYVCPSAGTYTIGAMTHVASSDSVIVIPTPAIFVPGTYTRAAATVTVTNTDYVYVCPFSTGVPSIAAPASTAAASTSAPASTTAASTSVPASSSSASPSASATSKVSSPVGVLGTDTDMWAITYTQYTQQGGCKDAATIMVEVGALAAKGFTTIRMYGTDCSGLQSIGAAVRAAGIKMIIGVFIDNSGTAAAASQVTDMISWNQFDLVELIIIGNEAVFGGHVSASDLVTFVSSSKDQLRNAGYNGLVSLTETVNIWQENAQEFCTVVDVVTFNSHAFFDASVAAADAGTFLETQFKIMNDLCPGLPESYNTESGWPNSGACNGLACPGVEEQAAAIASLRAAVGGKTVVFSFQNDLWKPAADQHWGVMGCF